MRLGLERSPVSQSEERLVYFVGFRRGESLGSA